MLSLYPFCFETNIILHYCMCQIIKIVSFDQWSFPAGTVNWFTESSEFYKSNHTQTMVHLKIAELLSHFSTLKKSLDQILFDYNIFVIKFNEFIDNLLWKKTLTKAKMFIFCFPWSFDILWYFSLSSHFWLVWVSPYSWYRSLPAPFHCISDHHLQVNRAPSVTVTQ